VLTSAVGARRTSTSLSRMMAAARTGDIAVSPALDPGAFRRLPEVVDAGRITYVFLGFPGCADGGAKIVPFAMGDDTMLRTVDRGRLLRGHRPAVGRADEVLISAGMAHRRHLGPGGRIRLQQSTPRSEEHTSELQSLR